MSEQKKSQGHPRTTPSEAPGEAGDQEARRQADEAVQDGSGDDADSGGAGRTAKRERPGIGREEQVRPSPPKRSEG
ncbi:hypothetical protein AMK16_22580 [Streptomyces sp. CB00455]|uniref:hypothetical protein n=1 Tax=Streptomyces sp. CB00455 TaxID=1703927 RepID=UPI00093EFB14|nr:hypothetical protein [Streptomyces sp. CB00455]OKK17584.1 hypothetical protein AMK16_22580 [Streptomyces sp. CB00455]